MIAPNLKLIIAGFASGVVLPLALFFVPRLLSPLYGQTRPPLYASLLTLWIPVLLGMFSSFVVLRLLDYKHAREVSIYGILVSATFILFISIMSFYSTLGGIMSSVYGAFATFAVFNLAGYWVTGKIIERIMRRHLEDQKFASGVLLFVAIIILSILLFISYGVVSVASVL